MIKAGITGGIGSGKSIICRVFENLGVPVYNADLAARLIIDTQPEIRKKLTAMFGEDIYNGTTLNRPRYASIIFRDKGLLEASNRIIHPWVRDDFNRWAEIHGRFDYVLEEAAILFEGGGNKWVDKCITIVSPVELRIKRLMKRSGMTYERIQDIMNNQWPDERKIAASDYTLINDEQNLVLPQIMAIHKQLSILGNKSSKEL